MRNYFPPTWQLCLRPQRSAVARRRREERGERPKKRQSCGEGLTENTYTHSLRTAEREDSGHRLQRHVRRALDALRHQQQTHRRTHFPSGLAASHRTSTAPSQSFVKSLEVLEHILVGRAARKEAPLLLHLLLLRINQFNDQEGEGEESGGGGGSHAKRIRIQTQKPCLARRKMSVRAAES